MARTLFRNAHVLDVDRGELTTARSVLVDQGVILAITSDRGDESGATVIDLDGRTVMPGLIDCHAHIDSAFMVPLPTMPRTTSVGLAYQELSSALFRGFTTLRDAGGADAGYKEALRRGVVVGPRLFVACKSLTQTGGHGDHRPAHWEFPGPAPTGKVVVDGADEVRRAVRENLRLGADHIKLMVSGGIASPTDPLEGMQFSDEEISVAVTEARRGETYCLAHAYSDEAVHRAASLGVRSIEHGSLLRDRAARTMAAAGAILVPTLSPYHWSTADGVAETLAAQHVERAELVKERANEAVAIAERHGVTMALGSDLFRVPKEHEAYELVLRAEVQGSAAALRSATTGGAELVGLGDRLGRVEEGFLADLLVVDGDPLEDLGLLQDEGAHLSAIMRAGELVSCRVPGAEPVLPPRWPSRA